MKEHHHYYCSFSAEFQNGSSFGASFTKARYKLNTRNRLDEYIESLRIQAEAISVVVLNLTELECDCEDE